MSKIRKPERIKKQPAQPSVRPAGLVMPAVLVSALLALVTLWVYWPALHCDFLNYDDDGYVTANPHVLHGLTPADVAWAFQTGVTGNWHPLTWLSLMLDAQWSGHGATAFHLTNLLLHAANAILLFLVLKQMTGAQWRSALVAVLFALHPLHVESVAWIAERKDVLSAFFFMLTLLAYVRFVNLFKVQNPKSKIFYLLSLFLFACGLMSKPMLVTLPFVLLLLDFWPLQRFGRSTIPRLVLEKIPFFLLSAISCVVTFLVQKADAAVKTLTAFPLGARFENAFVSCARYLEKTFWPVDLAMPYPYPAHWPAVEVALTVGLVMGASWLSLRLARRFPFALTGWFWFLGMLLPVIGLVQVGMQSMADRYTYLPLIGLFIALVWGMGEVWRQRHWPGAMGGVAMGLTIAVCAFLTRRQLGCWQNSETLFRHAVAVTDRNAIAYEHLGSYLVNEGRTSEAIDSYEKAIRADADYVPAHLDLGSTLVLDGKWNEAAQQYVAVLRLAPATAEAYNDLGYILVAQGRYDKAIAYYYHAIQLKPDFASAYHNLGLTFANTGRWDQAIRNYRVALQLDPGNVITHDDLGFALAHEGRRAEAVEEFNEALRLHPNDARALQQLDALQQ